MCQIVLLLGVRFQIDRVSFFPEVCFFRVCVFRVCRDLSKVGVCFARVAAQVEGCAGHAQGHEFPLDFVDLLSPVRSSREFAFGVVTASILVSGSVLVVLIFFFLRRCFGRLGLWFTFRLPLL